MNKMKKVQDLDQVMLHDLTSGKYRRIVFLLGAGVSVASGIPTFRSSEFGVDVETVFSIKEFRKNPEPTLQILNKYFRGPFQPTEVHRMLVRLKDYTLRVYTQNIDGLEMEVLKDPEIVKELHGNLRQAHCSKCHLRADISEFWNQPGLRCSRCHSPIKPAVVFYGEVLNPHLLRSAEMDFFQADLVIIIGTSLKVYPVAGLTKWISPNADIWLIDQNLPSNIPEDIKDRMVFIQNDCQVIAAQVNH